MWNRSQPGLFAGLGVPSCLPLHRSIAPPLSVTSPSPSRPSLIVGVRSPAGYLPWCWCQPTKNPGVFPPGCVLQVVRPCGSKCDCVVALFPWSLVKQPTAVFCGRVGCCDGLCPKSLADFLQVVRLGLVHCFGDAVQVSFAHRSFSCGVRFAYRVVVVSVFSLINSSPYSGLVCLIS